jgi:hypothetical protein
VLEANATAEGDSVELEQGAELGAPRDDEVCREQRRDDVVVGVEGDVIDGGVFGAKGHFDGGEGGVEKRERGGFGEVVKDGRMGKRDGDHRLHRFLGAAGFLGAG